MPSSEALLIQQIRNPMHTQAQIFRMVHENAHLLSLPFEHDARRLLLSFAEVESSLGRFNFRYEPAYGLSGLYYRKSKLLKEKYDEFGPLVAMSYGPWQIMYIVAVEHGYNGHPLALSHGEVSLPYVCEKMKRDGVNGARSLRLLASAYNGGNVRAVQTSESVQKYCNKLEAAFDKWLKTEIDWEKLPV